MAMTAAESRPLRLRSPTTQPTRRSRPKAVTRSRCMETGEAEEDGQGGREGQQRRAESVPFAVDGSHPPEAAPAPIAGLGFTGDLLQNAAGRHRLRMGLPVAGGETRPYAPCGPRYC